jgi:hypothetical protein
MSLLAYVVGCLTPFALILAWAAIIDWRDNANAKRANANWREAQRLREALRFYADKNNYDHVANPLESSPMSEDRGAIARAALEGQGKEES